MPRGPRIDAPLLLHHIRGRGVERRRIFLNDGDREDFLFRLNRKCEEHEAVVYAWCLMSNHYHLAIRSLKEPLSKTMSGLLTGYAMRFNKFHRREGHLFQNRYKSTIVEEERYFHGLIRYIHLNPLRARIVKSLEELREYPWTGHSVLMGTRKLDCQEVDEMLGCYGRRVGAARKELVRFMSSTEAKKDDKTFQGGGLVRSIGGLENLSEHRKGPKWSYDERILGEGKFVESVVANAVAQSSFESLSREKKRELFVEIAKSLCEQYDVRLEEVSGGSRRRKVSEVRGLLAYASNRRLGLSAAEIGRALNVSGQAILKAIEKAEETWESLDWITENLSI